MRIVSIFKSNQNNGVIALATFTAIIVASLISRVPFWYPFSFAAIQLFFIYLPGRSLVDRMGFRFNNGMTRDFLSYATGYVLSIVLYVLFLALNIQSYIFILYILIGSACCILYYRERNSTTCLKTAWRDKRNLSLIILIAFFIGCLTFQMVNLSPILFSDNSDSSIHYDLMYWMRNCTAATVSYPLPDLSFADNSLFYHYFSSLEIAFLHFVTGIEIYDLCFTYSYLINLFLLVSGAYVAISSIIQNERFIFVSLCFILFTTNPEFYSLISLSTHVYADSFGLTESLGIFFFAIFVYWEYLKDRSNKILLILLLLFFGTVGLKAPIAVVLLAGIGCNELYLLYKTRNWRSSIKLISCLVIVFFAVILLFVSGPVMQQSFREGGGHYMNLSLTGTIVVFTNRPFEALLGISLPFWVRYCISFIFFLIIIYFLHLILFLALFIFGKKKKGYVQQPDYLLLPIFIFGTLVSLFVSHPGRSQMYFIFPSILCLFIWVFSKYDGVSSRPLLNYVCRGAFLIGFLVFFIQNAPLATLGISRFMRSIDSIPSSTSDYLQDKAGTIIKKYDKNYFAILTSQNSGTSVSKNEIEGLRWVRDHLPSSALLLSNKLFGLMEDDEYSMAQVADLTFPFSPDSSSNPYKQVTSSHSTITSSFSERQTFMECYWFSNYSDAVLCDNLKWIKHFYQSDSDAFSKLKSKGVDYAVIFKRISPNDFPDNCTIIYDNSDISVVKL